MAETRTLEPELTTADLAGTKSEPRVEEPADELDTRPGIRFEDAGGDPPTVDLGPPRRSVPPDARETRPGTLANVTQPTPLFSASEAEALRRRWMEVQTGFVDEPRETVQQADTLVAETMKRLAEIFAQERASLEGQWSRGDEVSTEDLRLAMRRYRSFFDRLLSV